MKRNAYSVSANFFDSVLVKSDGLVNGEFTPCTLLQKIHNQSVGPVIQLLVLLLVALKELRFSK
jgi:hypothetical protein